MTAAAREAFARGAITLEQFERLAEIELLRAGPPNLPPPAGWEPLPPCEHEFVDITSFGELGHHRLCSLCGHEEFT